MKKTLLLNYLKAATSRNPRKNTTRFNGILALFVMVMGMGMEVSWGQISISSSTPVTESFTIGITATASLPTNWKMSAAGASSPSYEAVGNFTATNIQASSGTPSTGGRYNWGNGTTTTDRAIGFMTSGSYGSPNSIMAFYRNTSGVQINDITIAFDFERYRINSAAASVTFFTSTNGTTWIARTSGDIASGTFATGTSNYNFTSGTVVNRSFSITNVNIPNNGDFYVMWLVNTTGGNSQGIGLDNVSLTATLAAGNPSIALSSPTIPVSSVNNNTTNNIVGALQLDVTTADTTLNGVTFTTSGTYTASDISTNGFKFWLSTSATDISGATQLGAAQAAATTGSNITVSGLSNTITSATTRYVVLSADIAVSPTNGATLGIASTAHSNITFASGSKTGTDPVAASTTRAIAVAVPSIAISSNHPAAANINQNTNNQVFGSIALAVTTANATLNSIAITTAGTYQTSDLLASSFKLYYTTTNTFSTTTQLGSAQAIVASGNTITFSGLSQIINSGFTGYLWFTADVAYNAINGRTLSTNSTVFSNITFASGNKTGTDPVATGNDHTIATVAPSIAIAQNGPAASNVNLSATNAILYGLSLAVTANTTDFNSLTVTTGGTYQTSDLVASSFKLYYTTTNSFSSATLLSTSQAIVSSGNTITFSGINQNILIGTTGYLWVTVDISASAVATRTINITSTAFTNITFAAGNKTGTDPAIAGGTRTIAASPSMTELVVPQYIGSKSASGTNNTRTPIAICLQFDNLTASTAYDIGLQLEINGAAATSWGAGNLWNGTAFSGTTLLNAFTTNSSGSSGPVWFYYTATGNSTRFDAAQIHNVRVKYVTNGGTFPTDPSFIGTKNITALDIANSARTFGTTDDGAFITGTLPTQTSGKYVLLYTNETGTGDPIYSYQAIASTATNTTQSEFPTAINNIYLQSGTSNGQFAGVVPIGANNANGVRRIEVRNADNTIFASYSSSDGKWGSSADFTTLARRSIGTIDYTNVNNLTLNGSITLSAATSVFGNVTVQNSATLNTGNLLTLKSNASGTASVGNSSGTITGNVTVERYIPAKRAWRALTAPVSTTGSIYTNWQEGGTGNGVNGFDIWMPGGSNGLTSGGSSNSLLEYNSASNTWTGITATNGSSSMMNGAKNKPFMAFVTGPYGSGNISSNSAATTLRATGSLIIGQQTYTTVANKYTFIGNPYASPLSLSSMITSNNGSFEGNIWIWDANTSVANPVGIYNLYNNGTYTNVTNTPVASTTEIQSGQAFFVRSTAGDSFIIQESNKGTTNSAANIVFRDAAPAQLLRVGLYKQENTEWSGRDGAMTVILPDANANQTPNKMANGSENIAFVKNGSLFASNHHLPLVASDVLNIRVWRTTAGANYKLKINTEDFVTTNLSATLEDLFTNSRTPLNLEGTAVEYPFTVTTEALSTGDRFRIVFQNAVLGTNNPTATSFSIVPNPVIGDSFQVNLGTLATGKYSYSICNAIGQEVEKGILNNATQNTNYEVKMSNSATGIYIMKIKGSENRVITAKLIKK